RLPGMDLVRGLSWATVAVVPLALLDFVLTARFLLDLDLSVVASCCSVQLDAVASGISGFASGPRVLATDLAVATVLGSIVMAMAASRRPRPAWVLTSGLSSLVALPFAVAATVLEVAPYAFELPHHGCPFCLLKADVFGIGYVLFGAIGWAVVSGV